MNAKPLLTVSLLLNLTLAGTALYLVKRPSTSIPEVPALPSITQPTPASYPQTTTPFRWSQLESTDYAIYISNLRNIGCPEPTVREIVAADVADLFAPQRAPLLAESQNANATASQRNQAQETLRKLDQAAEAIIRRLFGISTPIEIAAPTPPQPETSPLSARASRPAVEDTNVSIPLVFQSVNSNKVALTAEERQTINDVQESFKSELGTNQDVNSREYLHNWQAAQQHADNLLNALLGRQSVLNYQAALETQATANAPDSAGN